MSNGLLHRKDTSNEWKFWTCRVDWSEMSAADTIRFLYSTRLLWHYKKDEKYQQQRKPLQSCVMMGTINGTA